MSPTDAIDLVRPRQWTKNLVVFGALVFVGELFAIGPLLRVCVAFVALCLVSGGTYSINDAMDAERDRQHPVKRLRPVASGRVSTTTAWVFGIVLLAAGLALSALLGLPFFLAAVAYVAIHALYTAWLKHVAIVDVLVIALGFVVRAIAGALVIAVPASPWLVVCAGLLALFLAAAKRRHEIVLLGDDAGDHRPVLRGYSAELLDSFMVTLAAATMTSYVLYTFFERRAPGYSMMFTIPFVIYGVLRYQYLSLHSDVTGSPEEVLLGDKPILADVVLWIVAAVTVIYVLPAAGALLRRT